MPEGKDLSSHTRTMHPHVHNDDVHRIVQMAWEDRTTFDAIFAQYGLREKEVIALMRHEMKRSSFEHWRERMRGRTTKHKALRSPAITRFKSPMQKH
jgi:uncharacterized protein (TIGR03643 family)